MNHFYSAFFKSLLQDDECQKRRVRYMYKPNLVVSLFLEGAVQIDYSENTSEVIHVFFISWQRGYVFI